MIKKSNYEAIKEILTLNMIISKDNNYLLTLRRLRHVIEKDIYKYDKKVDNINMIFFSSSI